MPFIAGDQIIGGSLHRTRQDKVIGLITGDHRPYPSRLDDGRCSSKHPESLGGLIRAPHELSHQNAADLIQDKGGEVRLEPAPPGEIEKTALVTGEVQA